MPRSGCYVGVAFYSFAPFPTQWALILSEHPQFLGPGWGSSPADTEGISWVQFERSPADFNPRGLFLGVVNVSLVPLSINSLMVVISVANQASAEDRTHVRGTEDIPWGSDKYVVLALLRLCRIGYVSLPRLARDSLAHFIGGRIRDLLRMHCAPWSFAYPVITLHSGSVVIRR
ncbi:hypothetical protein EI94DRAFT_1790301 [Lactarius quietus]|nr:hypothetical protein EI94DRAFT_1790301 [Lactarius quietus]